MIHDTVSRTSDAVGHFTCGKPYGDSIRHPTWTRKASHLHPSGLVFDGVVTITVLFVPPAIVSTLKSTWHYHEVVAHTNP